MIQIYKLLNKIRWDEREKEYELRYGDTKPGSLVWIKAGNILNIE